jgi:predicted neuraminidase
MRHTADSNNAELAFSTEWTVFGPCAETAPAPAAAELVVCPDTLRLGGQEFAAHKIKPSCDGINLGEILGGYRERLGAWVYIPVTAPLAGRYRIGLGADWWFEAFLDGRALKSTLATGNLKNPPRQTDHAAEADLEAGEHTLAVRVLSGNAGWMLDAGPQLAHAFPTTRGASPMQEIPPLWDPARDVPRNAELPQVGGAEFHVIKKQRPDNDGCNFTLGVGLAWHKDKLYASYAFNTGAENTATEEAHVRVSEDGGKTWGPTVVMDAGAGHLGVSHGVFLSHEGRLWAFMGAFYDNFQRTHTRAYTLNESSGGWEPQGVVVKDGFWPMQEPQRMADGNWIMSGIRVVGACGQDGANLPAVAISHGEDFTRWDLVVVPATPGLGVIWCESTVIVEDRRITNIARYGAKTIALVSVSVDNGRTWTPTAPSNLPMATSKPYAGMLSTGQRYLVCTTTADTGDSRAPLTIAVGQPGGSVFTKVFLIRHSECSDTPGISAPNADFSYPYAVEHDGKLYIGYTHKSHMANELAVVPVAALAATDAPARNEPASHVTQELLSCIHITPKLIRDPFPAYAEKYLPFAMASSMEATRKGRLWTCWAGGQDGPNAYLLASYSDDQGKSWRDPVFVIDPQAQGLKALTGKPFETMGTRLGAFWCDPGGRLWLFFHQSVGMFDGSCSNWFTRCDEPDAAQPVWTEPVYIGFGASLNKPIVRQNGEWILPVSLWERWHIDPPFADCYHELDAVRGADVFVSDDEGRSWRYRGGIIFNDSQFNEHSVVELADGRLWMLSRCATEAAQSFSSDGGRTWEPQSTAFPHTGSKSVFRRLQSGAILLIRHGQDLTAATPDRRELTAFLSTDDGQTWPFHLLLDERPNVSYPDIAQAPDGHIYVHYDRERTAAAEILFARFREEDVRAGRLVSAGSALKNIVKSKGGMNRGGGR